MRRILHRAHRVDAKQAVLTQPQRRVWNLMDADDTPPPGASSVFVHFGVGLGADDKFLILPVGPVVRATFLRSCGRFYQDGIGM